MDVRPTVAADLDHVAWRNRYRLHAWTARVRCPENSESGPESGRIVGIGGVQVMEDGTLVAFVDLLPEARRHPHSLHRAALRFMGELRRAGVRRVVATADPEQPAAERWLWRLGFVRVEVERCAPPTGPDAADGCDPVYLWQP